MIELNWDFDFVLHLSLHPPPNSTDKWWPLHKCKTIQTLTSYIKMDTFRYDGVTVDDTSVCSLVGQFDLGDL